MTPEQYEKSAARLDSYIGRSDEKDSHRSAPKPAPECLYGLVGDVGRAGGAHTEANEFAIAANFLAFMACCVGRGPYMTVGNTWHHARLFTLHVGRSGRGRKGDAVSLVRRIEQSLRVLLPSACPQLHSGGLSSREGLVFLIHDGFKEGKNEIEPVHDKRLWVVESEFANVLHQGRRDGNTLSAALRDCWDGVSLKPATKSNRLHATDPHVCLSGAVTPGELKELLAARELSNGFVNRFLVFWAERTKLMPFPVATPQQEVDALAARVARVLQYCNALERPANTLKMSLTVAAQKRWETLYHSELTDTSSGERINALVERRAPMLLRIAMLLALCDFSASIDRHHLEAALAWVRFSVASIKYIFTSAEEEAAVADTNGVAETILEYLKVHGSATRSDLSRNCLAGHVRKERLDAALDELLTGTPAILEMELIPRPKGSPGSPTKIYRWRDANCAKLANSEQKQANPTVRSYCEICEPSETIKAPVGTDSRLRTVRDLSKAPELHASTENSLAAQLSRAGEGEEEEVL